MELGAMGMNGSAPAQEMMENGAMPSEHNSERELGELSARMNMVETRIERIETKLDHLLELVTAGKGAWWLLAKVGAVAAGIIGGASWVISHVRL